MMLIIIFIVFALVSMSDVDPGRLKLGGEATEEEVYAYNEALGLYDPLIVRYGKYVFGILKGDFGTSYYYNEPVMNTVMGRWPNTIRLTLLSVGIAMVVGISLGVLSAVKQYSILDRIATVASMLLSAIPTFCMAALLVLTFSYKFKLVPASGITNGWKSWILPALTLGISYSAQFLRFARSTMLDTTRQDYIRTARAKGVPGFKVIFGHALKNSLIPVIKLSAWVTTPSTGIFSPARTSMTSPRWIVEIGTSSNFSLVTSRAVFGCKPINCLILDAVPSFAFSSRHLPVKTKVMIITEASK